MAKEHGQTNCEACHRRIIEIGVHCRLQHGEDKQESHHELTHQSVPIAPSFSDSVGTKSLACNPSIEPCDTRLIFMDAALGSSPALPLPFWSSPSHSQVVAQRTHDSPGASGHSAHCCAYLQGTRTQTRRLPNQLTHSPSTCRRDSHTVAKPFESGRPPAFIFLISSASAFARNSFVHLSSDFSSSSRLWPMLRITCCLNSLSKRSSKPPCLLKRARASSLFVLESAAPPLLAFATVLDFAAARLDSCLRASGASGLRLRRWL